jgi:hypothetical protein
LAVMVETVVVKAEEVKAETKEVKMVAEDLVEGKEVGTVVEGLVDMTGDDLVEEEKEEYLVDWADLVD